MESLTVTSPTGGTFEFSESIPPADGLVAECSHADDMGQAPAEHGTW
jgi:hypothetical protein